MYALEVITALNEQETERRRLRKELAAEVQAQAAEVSRLLQAGDKVRILNGAATGHIGIVVEDFGEDPGYLISVPSVFKFPMYYTPDEFERV